MAGEPRRGGDGGSLEETLLAAIDRALPEADTVYLYGSRASGHAREGSDVDLGVLAAEPLHHERLLRAREAIAEAVGRDVDLVDLARAPTVTRAQVVSGGRLLLDRAPQERERFEIYVYAAYARLNEERRGILERIRSEGRIHG